VREISRTSVRREVREIFRTSVRAGPSDKMAVLAIGRASPDTGGYGGSSPRGNTARISGLGKAVAVRGGGAVSEQSVETPEEDAAEQAREVTEDEGEELAEVPLEVDEADAAEQIRGAGYDDEDYR
jgi:hypothetical protein